MADNEHRLMSTPVSVNDGLKRADGRTWVVLGATVVVAAVIVLAINLFVPRQKLHWPTSPSASTPAQRAPDAGTPPAQDEPRTYDVAPPRQPQKNR